MKKSLFLFLLFFWGFKPTMAQLGLNIGLKAGLNFANVTNASSIKASNRTGYMLGGYIAPKVKKMFGFRSEIILSRQGYDYKSSTNTGNVNLDYLLLPQLVTINFTKYVQVQAGGQLAFLLNAKVDSTNGNNSGDLLSYFNRFDYGLAAGAEFFPIKALFIGARINVSFNNVNKEPPMGGNWPNYIPRLNAKNNVVQLYAGFRF